MDIANINAVLRPGSSPASRTAVANGPLRPAPGAPSATAVAVRGQPPPVEQVLQGELLQKRRKTSAYEATDLLDSLRVMDRLLRDNISTASAATSPRDARRAIASYTQQMIVPNSFNGSTAARTIDYFV